MAEPGGGKAGPGSPSSPGLTDEPSTDGNVAGSASLDPLFRTQMKV